MPSHTEKEKRALERGTISRDAQRIPTNPAATERSNVRRKAGSASGVASGSMGSGTMEVHTSTEEIRRGSI